MLGFDRLIITNLFALRSTDPGGLLVAADPIGSENDETLKSVFERASMTVCAWGTRPNKLFVLRRMRSLVRILPPALHCLKISKDGLPCHPLYLSYDLTPQRYYIDRF